MSIVAVVWTYLLGGVVSPDMPRCQGCGFRDRDYKWIGMRYLLRPGAWDVADLTWVLCDVDDIVEAPVCLPDMSGSVLRCGCGKYWFREDDNLTMYLLCADAPMVLWAVRRWGRWHFNVQP